jgi:predicted acyl esterase
MRDGIRIAVDIYYPDGKGKFPALLGMSPYGKDVQMLPSPDFPTSDRLGNAGIEAGNTEYFVRRGYVHIIADSRGTGRSEGKYGLYSRKEYEDGYDLVEWIASQEWSNKKVGLLGISYFAVIQYGIAALKPPHLKAIFPADGYTDLYRHRIYHGGILNISFIQHWWPMVIAHTMEPSDIPDNDLAKLVEKLRKDRDIMRYPTAYIALTYPYKNPHLFDALTHPLDGPYYWERSAYTKFGQIDLPTYLLSRWTAWSIHLPGAFRAYHEIGAPKKLMITIPESGVGFNRPWHECHDLILRWYDHWLKGIDTGIMNEPPIKLFVQGVDKWRYENEWPLSRTKWTKMYLRENNKLSETPPKSSEKPDKFTNTVGLKPGENVPSIRYRTGPLKIDTEITGPSALHFFAAIDKKETTWIVEIKDIDNLENEKLVSIGWLRASHRELDKEKSKPYEPFHPHLRSVPVNPGDLCEYAIEIRETSMVFKAGHKIELLIKAQDVPWEGKEYYRTIFLHLPHSEETQHTIYHTNEYLSFLLLPVVPN